MRKNLVRFVDLNEVEPQNIRHASHGGASANLRVIVREHEASTGGVDLPGGASHFWLAFRQHWRLAKKIAPHEDGFK